MGRMWEATAYSCGGEPQVYVVPDLHKGPRMSPKMAPLMFTKMSGNLSSVQPKPKWLFHALNTYPERLRTRIRHNLSLSTSVVTVIIIVLVKGRGDK
jgi:hypothetical protein